MSESPNPHELPQDVDPEAVGHFLKAALSGPDVSDEFPHTFTYSPREFMRPDEIAAQISAEKDVHVDCVLAVLDWLAEKWETDADELVRFDVKPYTIVDLPEAEANGESPKFRLSEGGTFRMVADADGDAV